MMRKIGIKGFDKDLKCKNYQFEIGKIHEDTMPPKLCARGFHYCHTVKDCFSFYNNGNGNRFCIVEILGEVDEGRDKSCTNKIKLIRELTAEELAGKSTALDERKLQSLNQKGYVIGGSVALIIHGYDLGRTPKDIDLVIDNVNHKKIESDFAESKQHKRYSGSDSIYGFEGYMGEQYDILKTDKVYAVTRNYKGVDILVCDAAQIWDEKLKYALEGSMKHINDIKKCGIKFNAAILWKSDYINDELPF